MSRRVLRRVERQLWDERKDVILLRSPRAGSSTIGTTIAINARHSGRSVIHAFGNHFRPSGDSQAELQAALKDAIEIACGEDQGLARRIRNAVSLRDTISILGERSCVLIIDDADSLPQIQQRGLLDELRQWSLLRTDHRDYDSVRVMLIGMIDLWALFPQDGNSPANTFFKVYPWELDLEYDEAEEMVNNRALELRRPLSRGAASRLYSLTQGHVGLLDALFELLSERRFAPISRRELDVSAQRLVEEALDGRYLGKIVAYFRKQRGQEGKSWLRIRRLLKQLATGRHVQLDRVVEEARSLELLGVVRAEPQSNGNLEMNFRNQIVEELTRGVLLEEADIATKIPRGAEIVTDQEEIAAEVYRILYQFERTSRNRLTAILRAEFGDEWWQAAVPSEVRQSCEGRQKEHSAHTADNIRHPLISYSDFNEIPILIKAEPAWSHCFQRRFNSQDQITQLFAIVSAIRNSIAHCRNTSDDEMQRLHDTTANILSFLR